MYIITCGGERGLAVGQLDLQIPEVRGSNALSCHSKIHLSLVALNSTPLCFVYLYIFLQVSVSLQCLFVGLFIYLSKDDNVNYWDTGNCVYPTKFFCTLALFAVVTSYGSVLEHPLWPFNRLYLLKYHPTGV